MMVCSNSRIEKGHVVNLSYLLKLLDYFLYMNIIPNLREFCGSNFLFMFALRRHEKI